MVKTALVTGAAKGIGRAIALKLAAQGHDIAIHYRSSKDEAEAVRLEVEAFGVRAVALSADLRDANEAQNLVSGAAEAFPQDMGSEA